MARKRKPSKSSRAPSAVPPRWKSEGYRSYRAYLDARFRALGFKSFADYTKQRLSGAVPPIRETRRQLAAQARALVSPPRDIGAMPPAVKRQLRVVSRQPPPVGELHRLVYDAPCPIDYDIDQFVGNEIVAWLNDVFARIEAEAAAEGRTIHSGAWQLFGRIALDLDENGDPVFEPGERPEWTSHADWSKCKQTLLALAFEYGNHSFRDQGRIIGRNLHGRQSKIYVFIIRRVRITISYPPSGMVPP